MILTDFKKSNTFSMPQRDRQRDFMVSAIDPVKIENPSSFC